MDIREIITTDKEVLSGQPVFAGTRVSVESLFDHLEAGVSLDEFLEDFPTVAREQAVALLDIANKIMTSGNVTKLYEAIVWRKSAKEA